MLVKLIDREVGGYGHGSYSVREDTWRRATTVLKHPP